MVDIPDWRALMSANIEGPLGGLPPVPTNPPLTVPDAPSLPPFVVFPKPGDMTTQPAPNVGDPGEQPGGPAGFGSLVGGFPPP